MNDEEQKMRVTLRLAMVALIAALELILLIALLHGYDQAIGDYGFTVAKDGVTIASVEPELPAALAGIRAGDRIDYKTLSLTGRRLLILKEPVPAQTPLTLQFIRDGQPQTLTLQAQTIPGTLTQITALANGLSGFVFGIIGLILVMLRPSRMTWAFACIAAPLLLPLSLFFFAQHAETFTAACVDIGISMLVGMQTAGLLMFASRFPTDKPHGFAAFFDRLSTPAGIFVAGIYIYATLTVRYTTTPLPWWEMISTYALLLPSLAALIVLVANYITTHGSVRSRLAPVIASFILLIALGVSQQIITDVSTNINLLFFIYLAYAVAPAIVAIAVAYGVIRHRVMDIDFIIQRTLVYTLLTVLVVAIFSVIEFFVGKLFEGRFADMVQMAAAVIVGVSINYVHGKLEHFMNVLFFRRRYTARRRLIKLTQTLPHATTLALIDEMLVVEPVDALDLASAAVFRREGNSYVRVKAHGWNEDTSTTLAQDDHLVVRAKAELQAIKIPEIRWPLNNVPTSHARPIYAVPVLMGHQLEAILLFGAHRTGEDLDSDERKSLNAIARAAALAYGHLIQEQLSEKLQTLNTENLTLTMLSQKFESLLKARLN
jgi:S1-C subfamily serine protease